MMAGMENSTNTVAYEWEYYYDYVDPVTVDESKLKYNKYLMVIIFWIILAAFVGLLFLTLNLMSHSGSLPTRATQHPQSPCVILLFCFHRTSRPPSTSGTTW
uniref:Melanocortin 2 receptor accessory protein n=1 Tax=Mola mola TaxID=94237 RepID=A0A3Q3X6D6_MOLML